MKEIFIRVWEEKNIDDINGSLLLIGELSYQCFMCKNVGIKVVNGCCSSCGRKFKYIGFRRKVEASYVKKIKEEFPNMVLIEFEDFKRALGKKEARNILDI